jgi:PAS domain S-box-containing protein
MVMSRIAGDPFLEAALRGRVSAPRVTTFEGRQTYEVVQPFLISEGRTGLLRVGLSMDAVREAEKRVRNQIVVVIGLLTGASAVFIGLVAVRQSYALLRRAHVRLESTTGNILSGMADAVVAVDREGRITVFNRAAERIFESPASEAVGQRWSDLMVVPAPGLEEAILRGEAVTDAECRYETRGGRRLVLSVSTAPLRDDEGRIDGGVAVVHDLTERKRLEEEASRQDRLTAMGELASGVAHEVRNPLNAIGVIAQRLKREFVPTEEVTDYRALVDIVRAEVERVDGIIRQFLEFARPPRLSPCETDVAALLEETVRVVESRAQEKGVTIRRDFDGAGRAVLDPDQMKQALLNLLKNAVEATERGMIAVSASGGEWVEIVVSDPGYGIPPENLSRIFDLYFTTRPEGTGLGLSQVHRIVAEHRGQIHVVSEPGEGTRFTVTLPRS